MTKIAVSGFRIRIRIPNPDPDPHQYVMDPEHVVPGERGRPRDDLRRECAGPPPPHTQAQGARHIISALRNRVLRIRVPVPF